MVARLVGRDAPGQPGISADANFTLPERPFQNPVARALIAIRKGLSLHPEDRDSAVDALDTLIMQPQLLAGVKQIEKSPRLREIVIAEPVIIAVGIAGYL